MNAIGTNPVRLGNRTYRPEIYSVILLKLTLLVWLGNRTYRDESCQFGITRQIPIVLPLFEVRFLSLCVPVLVYVRLIPEHPLLWHYQC